MGNFGFGENHTVMFETADGFHDGNRTPGDSKAVTNTRLRWFHLFDMDSSVVSGHGGWATQVDLQIVGELKGTEDQNTLGLGCMAAFGINKQWSF